jgi:hypothetical protein
MNRFVLPLFAILLQSAPARADVFDHYTNFILVKVPKLESTQDVKQVTLDMMIKHSRVLPGVPGTFIVVETNGGRMAKLLVQPARQKVTKEKSVPILLIDRFTTFVEDTEKAVQATGKNVRLFGGFHFDLDLGQVVPEALGGDLRVVVLRNDTIVEPVGKAKIYLMTEHLAEANPKKLDRPEIGAVFEPRYFNGVYKLYDDGRRSGTLHLKVLDKGEVGGFYYSGKDGQKYDVGGKVGDPHHSINFRIMFPKTVQTFHGWLFTGDGRALVGSSRLQDRETGFYAIREE